MKDKPLGTLPQSSGTPAILLSQSQHPGNGAMRIYLLPTLWLIAMYIGTALMAGLDPAPQERLARLVFEARHVVTHTLAFAVQIGLIVWATRRRGQALTRREGLLLIGLGLALGLGQEALQAILRTRLYVVNSAFDVAVDGAGSVLGWWAGHLGHKGNVM